MSTTHSRRNRHRQVARNLTIAVATAALAGTGAAMAADSGIAPPNAKPADSSAGSAKSAPKTGERPPLAANEPLVTDARARLQSLVADGTIAQTEADVVLGDVIAGSVDPEALVRAGSVSAAHMPAIATVLDEVKRAHATPGG
jgi:hypothetical protein